MTINELLSKVKEAFGKAGAFLKEHKGAVGLAALSFMVEAGWCLMLPNRWWWGVIVILLAAGGFSLWQHFGKKKDWDHIAINLTGIGIGMIIALLLFMIGALA